MYGKKFNIVVDCDEVLVRISPKWVYKLHEPENYNRLKEYLQLSPNFDIEKDYTTILNRDTFQLFDWLLLPEAPSMFSEHELAEVKEKVLEVYNDPFFYDDLVPTNLANALTAIARNSSVEKITVITRDLFPDTAESKTRFLKNLFRHTISKLEIYSLEPGEKKSDVIKDLKNVSLIYEDELDNVRDIIDNCPNLEGVILQIPTLGYNSDYKEIAELEESAGKKGCLLRKYKDIELLADNLI